MALAGLFFIPQGHFLAQPSAELTARCKGPLMAAISTGRCNTLAKPLFLGCPGLASASDPKRTFGARHLDAHSSGDLEVLSQTWWHSVFRMHSCRDLTRNPAEVSAELAENLITEREADRVIRAGNQLPRLHTRHELAPVARNHCRRLDNSGTVFEISRRQHHT
jgi:hypothetical protein